MHRVRINVGKRIPAAALITNAFASASASADANGLGFTSRVFGRVAQAQAGRTAMRLDTLEARNGY